MLHAHRVEGVKSCQQNSRLLFIVVSWVVKVEQVLILIRIKKVTIIVVSHHISLSSPGTMYQFICILIYLLESLLILFRGRILFVLRCWNWSLISSCRGRKDLLGSLYWWPCCQFRWKCSRCPRCCYKGSWFLSIFVFTNNFFYVIKLEGCKWSLLAIDETCWSNKP